jgi:hypothetical protein
MRPAALHTAAGRVRRPASSLTRGRLAHGHAVPLALQALALPRADRVARLIATGGCAGCGGGRRVHQRQWGGARTQRIACGHSRVSCRVGFATSGVRAVLRGGGVRVLFKCHAFVSLPSCDLEQRSRLLPCARGTTAARAALLSPAPLGLCARRYPQPSLKQQQCYHMPRVALPPRRASSWQF